MKISVSTKNDETYEALFDDLIQEVFNFSFAPWFALKLWDKRYESYSIIQSGKMLSNACIYKSALLVQGETVSALQFGAVATRPEERKKGYAKEIMECILDIYQDEPCFLAANHTVSKFYQQFGFRQIRTYRPIVDVEINNLTGRAVQCAPDEDLVIRALENKRICSFELDIINTQSVKMFHLLLNYANSIYYLPTNKVVVIAKQQKDKLFIADIIAHETLLFKDLLWELPFNGVKYVEFGFCPDWLKVNPHWEEENLIKNPFFVRGEWSLPPRFRFPVLSET